VIDARNRVQKRMQFERCDVRAPNERRQIIDEDVLDIRSPATDFDTVNWPTSIL